MKPFWMMCVSLALPVLSLAADGGDQALIAKLGQAKHSLAEGIAQAERENGLAISAKFELEDGKLMLSVYTAKQGRERDAEHNTLIEMIGEATTAEWQPKTAVFEDKAHIARSAMQLTLMQMTKLTLADIIRKASSSSSGTVYSAIPAVKGGRPILNVRIAAPDGKTVALDVDAQTGQVVK